MWTKIAFASAVLLGAAGAANAADLIVDDVALEAAVPAGDWSGAYVGGHVGYASGTADWELLPQPGPSDDYALAGWLVGVQGGYNWQIDTFVLGLEGDISLSGIEGDDQGFIARQVNWAASLRARAGVAVDAVLLYGTAGVAVANSTGEVFISDETETHLGWTAGVGVEAMVAENVSIKAEYAYTDYGTAQYDYFLGALPVDTNVSTHSIKAGVNFHF